MQHLDDGLLHALVDGEIPSAELGPMREHLDGCAECRARLDEARNEADTARELVELIEVPVDGRTGRRADGPSKRRSGWGAGRWLYPLAWAASLVLAVGLGYKVRNESGAMPASVTRHDTVRLPATPPPAQAPEPAASDATRLDQTMAASTQGGKEKKAETLNARTEPERRADKPAEVAAATADERGQRVPAEGEVDRKVREKNETGKLRENALERDRASGLVATKKAADAAAPAAAPATPPPTLQAENRVMAKTAALDAEALAPASFTDALAVLGGRIRLIEGMVPARLESSGRVVRVIYVVSAGDLVLEQQRVADSLAWKLTGPLTADSLTRLRARVR